MRNVVARGFKEYDYMQDTSFVGLLMIPRMKYKEIARNLCIHKRPKEIQSRAWTPQQCPDESS